jgi:hypothetical protein
MSIHYKNGGKGCDADGRQYNISVLEYAASDDIPVIPGCFSYMFTNIGTAVASVNGMRVFPSATPATALGDSRTVSGHKGDIFVGKITLRFNAPVPVGALVEIVQLFYPDIKG